MGDQIRVCCVCAQGYSLSSKCSNTTTSSSLLKRCNHHSSRVLEALMDDSTALPETMSASLDQPEMALHLKRSGSMEGGMTSSESLLHVADDVKAWHVQLVRVVSKLILSPSLLFRLSKPTKLTLLCRTWPLVAHSWQVSVARRRGQEP